MLRVITETKPRYIIGENVAGIVTMGLDQVLSDLEDQGYSTQAVIIPACAVNAPHRRDRVWIICHTSDTNSTKHDRSKQGDTLERQIAANSEQSRSRRTSQIVGSVCESVTDTDQRQARPRDESKSGAKEQQKPCTDYTAITNTTSEGLEGRLSKQRQGSTEVRQATIPGDMFSCWKKTWSEVATELCGMDDGLPAELDGLNLSKAKHRVERLKGLGNAVIPRIVEILCSAIREVDSAIQEKEN